MSNAPCFANLPEEICLHILGLLELKELLVVARTNRRLHRLTEDDLLWQHLFLDASYRCSPRDEEQGIPYKVLFKQEHGIDCNWRGLNNLIPYEVQTDVPQLGHGQHRLVMAIVCSGGRNPLVAAAYTGSHVELYNLGDHSTIKVPGDDVRSLALVLDTERFKEHKNNTTLPNGVSEGWGTNGLLLVTGGRKLKVWNIPSRIPVPIHSMKVTSGVRCLRAISGSSQLLSGSRDGSVRLWDIQAGTLIKELSSFADGVFCLDAGYDDKGGLIGVGGSMDCSGRIWDLETEDFKILRGHRQAIHRIMLHSDIVITGSLDSTIRTWSIATGESLSLITIHKMAVSHMTITKSPLLSLVSVAFDGTVAIHNLQDEAGERLLIPRSSKCVELHCRGVIEAGNCYPYFVVGDIGRLLWIIQPTKEMNFFPGRRRAPNRYIDTGFSTLHRVAVVRQGIVTIGTTEAGRTCMRFHNFAEES